MKYSNFTSRISGEGAEAWKIHDEATERLNNGEDIILLSIGDPDFDTSNIIVDAAIQSLKAGDTHYAEFMGDKELRSTLASLYSKHAAQPVGPDNVIILAGAQCALYCAAHCLLDPGDEIIVPEPTYVTYEAVIGATGANIVNVPMDPDQNFRLDIDKLEEAISPRSKAILLTSPHNPTGRCISKEEWQQIGELCEAHDLWLISDEVYASLVYEGEHNCALNIPTLANRCIIVNSLSKSHAMSGWRLGWLVGPELFIQHVCNMVTCMLYGCPTFIQKAAILALNSSEHICKPMADVYRSRRDLAHKKLNSVPDLHCGLPRGGMFLMVDIRKSGLSAQEFSSQLLRNYGVSALAGEAFGKSAAGHLRISLCVSKAELLDACNRIVRCFTELKQLKNNSVFPTN
ncbi:pyridoxal phosphate-dependent aminotransferase [Pseudoteredinibacter isoporae]|uniref:pyridoxal phosphate-dependent aminotransferase n=1 Tax=Pseudoteredinibacter isoporae TaxID=570281 RepID=UPI00310A9FE9